MGRPRIEREMPSWLWQIVKMHDQCNGMYNENKALSEVIIEAVQENRLRRVIAGVWVCVQESSQADRFVATVMFRETRGNQSVTSNVYQLLEEFRDRESNPIIVFLSAINRRGQPEELESILSALPENNKRCFRRQRGSRVRYDPVVVQFKVPRREPYNDRKQWISLFKEAPLATRQIVDEEYMVNFQEHQISLKERFARRDADEYQDDEDIDSFADDYAHELIGATRRIDDEEGSTEVDLDKFMDHFNRKHPKGYEGE